MEFELDIVRNVDCEAEDELLLAVVKETVSRSGIPSLSVPVRVSVGIALVSDDEIRELNRTYRNKDASTDVLSFAEYEGEEICPDADGGISLGDLVIAPAFVRCAADDDGVPFLKELAFVCSHGILHLLGFDHSAEMFRIQDETTESICRP
ncbi:MAG: rRNA maturation RNase YbeY [Candidatus Moranbacteria bacterium]|nr:rRNA maturation RNase YbeY [Candidatus Moranbacteria bacterium]